LLKNTVQLVINFFIFSFLIIEIFNNVTNNIKKKYKSEEKEDNLFLPNGNILLNTKFIKTKKGINNKGLALLKYKKIKNQNIYDNDNDNNLLH